MAVYKHTHTILLCSIEMLGQTAPSTCARTGWQYRRGGYHWTWPSKSTLEPTIMGENVGCMAFENEQ